MKHIKLFEQFKRKNIEIGDIINCIRKGGELYAFIVDNLPDHDEETPLTPLSVDDDGLTTIEFEGSHYEVKLKNIKKVEF